MLSEDRSNPRLVSGWRPAPLAAPARVARASGDSFRDTRDPGRGALDVLPAADDKRVALRTRSSGALATR